MRRLKQYFFAGIVFIVPLAVTVYVLFVLFSFFDSIIGRYIQQYIQDKFGFYIPGIGVALLIIIILITGFFANRFFRHGFFIRIEQWFSKLPLVANLYPTLKQVILFVAAQKEFGFKSVVLVEYPRKGIWTLGFLTNEHFSAVNKAANQQLIAVYLPMSPNPLSGYVAFFERSEIVPVDMTVAQALNVILSAGVFGSQK
ncbi:MAG: DUF502 domain-containing protein [Candidatus Omnitrophica bacterium]|nr:DUF502 domain-containing protein [Candidatus Omnitrophota bacterium]